MTAFEKAEYWVSRNYPDLSVEEKERLTTAFIAGMSENISQIMDNNLDE